MLLEQSLNGGYKGLYGEVVTYDSYKLRTLNFIPDLIIDIGANVGVFSRFARELFPNAKIVAVEPHPENIEVLTEYAPDNITIIPAALGKGQLWHNKGAVNGAHESYVCTGLGFNDNEMSDANSTEKSDIKTIMLQDLITIDYYYSDIKILMKIDCEGGENVIWDDENSMSILKRMDYIAMETHFYALHGGPLYDEMKQKTLAGIESLKVTHKVDFTHPYLFARKRTTPLSKVITYEPTSQDTIS